MNQSVVLEEVGLAFVVGPCQDPACQNKNPHGRLDVFNQDRQSLLALPINGEISPERGRSLLEKAVFLVSEAMGFQVTLMEAPPPGGAGPG